MSLKESLILGQNLAKPLKSEEGPGYGERLTGLEFEKLPKGTQVALRILGLQVIVLTTLTAGEAARAGLASAYKSGPTPAEVPTPEGTAKEMAEFERKIGAIREPGVIRATPTATEIQQEQKVQAALESGVYVVGSEENLTTIAEKFGLPWQALYGKNLEVIDQNPDLIRAGTILSIPDQERDGELISVLTPREISEADMEIVGPSDSRYFSETGQYVSGSFLEKFEELGLDVLGYPISKQGGGLVDQYQTFENMQLWSFETDWFSYLPERPQYETEGPHFYPWPIGWTLYFRIEKGKDELPVPGDPEFPMPGDFDLAEELKDFHQTHGGNEVLGYPISEAKWENGALVQWLINSRLEYDPERTGSNKVQLGPLGQEYADAFLQDSSILERESPRVQLDVLDSLAKETPEELRALEARAVAAVVYYLNGPITSFDGWKQGRDNEIIFYHRYDKLPGTKTDNRPFDYQTALLALTWHEKMLQENPVVQQVIDEMVPGTKAINRLLTDRLSPDLFKGEKIPQLPETPQEMLDRIIFAGGNDALGGGEAYADRFFSTLFGRYDLLSQVEVDDVEEARRFLSQNTWHEFTHTLVQNMNNGETSSNDREGLLAHMSMGAIEMVGEETIGRELHFDPRIIYIYSRLKDNGDEDPFGLIVKAAATGNGGELWEIYEQIRGDQDWSMEQLMATDDPSPATTYYTSAELETFRTEFQPYLGR